MLTAIIIALSVMLGTAGINNVFFIGENEPSRGIVYSEKLTGNNDD